MHTKHDRIKDGNIEIRILHEISKILVYKTSGHQIFHHIPPISWSNDDVHFFCFEPGIPFLENDSQLVKFTKVFYF